jgi:hypothetical protein
MEARLNEESLSVIGKYNELKAIIDLLVNNSIEEFEKLDE